MKLQKFMFFKYCIILFLSCLLINSCNKETDLIPTEPSNIEKESEQKITDTAINETTHDKSGCPCPGWECVDLDNGNILRQGGVSSSWYTNQGWNKKANPVRKQRWSSPGCNQGCWKWWVCDKDKRFYFTDSYFANPANASNIKVRYNSYYSYTTPVYTCGTPILDYLQVPSYDYSYQIGPPGTKYVRLTLGEFCAEDISLVAN